MIIGDKHIFEGVVLCKTMADYEALTKNDDMLYIIEEDDAFLTKDEAAELYVEKDGNKVLTTNDLTNTLKTNYDTAYTRSHTHANKSVLDALKVMESTTANPLVNKDFVNSSVATNTANYISNSGQPFTSLAQLQAYAGTVTNNDYAFVTGTDAQGNTYYDRYKATVSGSTVTWSKEYRLNNSSFTAEQWAAISSGITGAKVSAYDAHLIDTNNPHNVTAAILGLGNVDNTSDANKPISTATQTALNGKQNTLVPGTGISISGNTISALINNTQFYYGWGSLKENSSVKTVASIKGTRQWMASGKSTLTVNMSCNCIRGPSSEFTFGYLSQILSILGITSTIVSVCEGNWQEFGGTGQMDRNLTGYGTRTNTNVSGNWFQLGRYYNESGAYGDWPLNQFQGKIIEITGMVLYLNN